MRLRDGVLSIFENLERLKQGHGGRSIACRIAPASGLRACKGDGQVIMIDDAEASLWCARWNQTYDASSSTPKVYKDLRRRKGFARSSCGVYPISPLMPMELVPGWRPATVCQGHRYSQGTDNR